MRTPLADFLNRIRLLTSIDRNELIAGAVIGPDDLIGWSEFRRDPTGFMLRKDDYVQGAIWALLERKSKPPPTVSMYEHAARRQGWTLSPGGSVVHTRKTRRYESWARCCSLEGITIEVIDAPAIAAEGGAR